MTYSETLKTAENDYIHLTVNDSGTLVISDKISGNVYFEMLTCFGYAELEDGASVSAYALGGTVRKFSSPALTHFDIQQSLPCKTEADFSPRVDAADLVAHRIALAEDERALRVLSAQKKLCADGEMTTVLRFPTGADYPTITLDDGSACDINTPFTVRKSGSVTVTSENGSAFRISEINEDVTVIVSEDGNIDLILQSAELSYVLEPIDA